MIDGSTQVPRGTGLVVVWTYRCRKWTQEIMPYAEAISLPLDDVDVLWNKVAKYMRISKAAATIIEHRGRISGIGPRRLDLLDKLLFNMEWWLEIEDLDALGHPDPVPAFSALRKYVFHESGRNADFLETAKPFAGRFSPNKTIRIIEWPGGPPRHP